MAYNQNNPLPRLQSALKMAKQERAEKKPPNLTGGANEAGQEAVQETAQQGISRHGSMKGDQSATHTDYAHYKGTDPHYHGHDGESHGDQSATHKDYLHGNGGVSRKSSPANYSGLPGVNEDMALVDIEKGKGESNWEAHHGGKKSSLNQNEVGKKYYGEKKPSTQTADPNPPTPDTEPQVEVEQGDIKENFK